MFSTENIVIFLVVAAVVGFFLDERRKRLITENVEIEEIPLFTLPRRR